MRREVVPTVKAATADLEQRKKERAALVRESSALEHRLERGPSADVVDELLGSIETKQREIQAVDFHIKAATRRLEAARAAAPARRAKRKELASAVREAGKLGRSIGTHLDAIQAVLGKLTTAERNIKALRAELGLPGVEGWAPLGVRLNERIRLRIPVDIAAEDHFSDANMRMYLAEDEDADDAEQPQSAA